MATAKLVRRGEVLQKNAVKVFGICYFCVGVPCALIYQTHVSSKTIADMFCLNAVALGGAFVCMVTSFIRVNHLLFSPEYFLIKKVSKAKRTASGQRVFG